jgi:hydrogenase assembly chaperone HypC/HupF
MCLLVPGKIIEIKDNEALVDYDLEKRKGVIIDADSNYQVGDYVMIQGGFLVQKVEEKEAKQALELYKKAVNQE